jgi:hypothetical protein
MNLMKVLFLTLLLSGCASREGRPGHPSGLVIEEVSPNKWTAITRQNLLHLTQVYDLSPFIYTKNIQIESMVIPQSHPVLLLNTRYAEKPKKLLSVFLHEQLHWWTTNNQIKTNEAIKDLKKVYPNAPVTTTSGKDSTHLHLIICYLEYKALKFYLGKTEATEIITSLMKQEKIYPWVYYQVIYKNFAIEKIVKKTGLLPPPL